jgi:hypothetical protein
MADRGRGERHGSRSHRRRISPGEAGQAAIELLAGLPLLFLAGALALQILVAGYSLTLADGAAEAGALALAAGRPATPAARDALPGWARERVAVEIEDGRVRVTVRPPSLLRGVSRRLEVSSSAWVRAPAGVGA